ncbi:hypothetical protein [Parvibaculum sp.]|uniref:hypothetical protein n=1 Tax=Parvibaculum sp. TaxID=2024848 RepID=UPI00320C1BBD
MAVAARSSDIPVQWGASYAPDEGRFQTRTGWWHPKAAFAADFFRGKFARGGSDVALDSFAATVRSSSHLLADATGIYRTFAPNALATLAGVGAYIGGQVTNCWGSPDNLDDTATWAKQNTPVIFADGDFCAVADDSSSATEQLLGTGSIAANAASYAMWVDLKKDSENTVMRSVTFRLFGGTTQSRSCAVNTSTGAYHFGTGNGTPFFYDLGDRWRVGLVIQNNGTNTRGDLYINPCFNTSLSATAADATLTGTASFSWPHMIAGPYPGPRLRVKGTRYASDVQATNMDWFNAAGLAGGGAGLVIPNWGSTGHGVSRTLFELSDGTTNNLVRAYANASDRPALLVVAGGVTQTDTALSAPIALGRKPLIFKWGAAGGYVADGAGNAASIGAITLPTGLAALRLGSSLAGNYLNSVLEQIQICRAMDQSEAQAWAVTA